MQPVHFQVRVGVFNCQQILVKISFVIFDIVKTKKKQIECGLAWHWWNSTDLGLTDMFLISLNAEIVACILSFRKSRQMPNVENTSKYGFSPDLGGKNGGVLSMRMQVILDSSFARPGSAPIWGGKKGEFRDWTIFLRDHRLSLILKETSFHFNGKNYFQTHGIAMGTKMTVFFARIFMAAVDRSHWEPDYMSQTDPVSRAGIFPCNRVCRVSPAL